MVFNATFNNISVYIKELEYIQVFVHGIIIRMKTK